MKPAFVSLALCLACFGLQSQQDQVWVVVLASKTSLADAQAEQQRITQTGLHPLQLLQMTTPNGMRYRVVVVSQATRALAEEDRKEIVKQSGIADAWLLQVARAQLQVAAPKTKPISFVIDTTGFSATLRQWAVDLAQMNVAQLRQRIHPKYGLFTKTSVGVLPHVQNLTRDEYLKGAEQWDAASVGVFLRKSQAYLKEQLRYGSIRAYDCDVENKPQALVFSLFVIKEGSLSAPLQQRLQTEADAMEPPQVATTQRALQLATQIEGRACVAVHLSSLHQFEVLYFIREGDAWYWIIQDNAEPCSA